MPLPTSGPISLSNVNTELGLSSTAQISLGSTAVRTLFGVSSGAISKSNGRGKSNTFTFNKTISTNTQNYNLLNDMIANGYTNGSAFVVNVTVNNGVYVWSDDTALAGFDTGTIAGTGTVSIINNGFIIGKGGNSNASGNAGSPGGPAMSLRLNCIITNNSYICGGGGGGGSSGSGGGGGAGGGRGGTGVNGLGGGAGGTVGLAGSDGTTSGDGAVGGGGGGRIVPGNGGASTVVAFGGGAVVGKGGGAGGGGSAISRFAGEFGFGCGGQPPKLLVANGGGGGWGATGGVGYSSLGCQVGVTTTGGAGGSNNSAGNSGSGTSSSAYAGGAGGKAINLNGNSVTYIATGTIYGAVS